MTSPGSLAELLLLLNNAGVTEYSDGTTVIRLAGHGATTQEQLRKPVRREKSKVITEPFDDIGLALNGPPAMESEQVD